MKTAAKAPIKKCAVSHAAEKGKKANTRVAKYVDLREREQKLNTFYARVLAPRPAPGTAVEMVRAVRKGK